MKAQLNFRKHVLAQKPKEKDVLNFTQMLGKPRVNLNIDGLTYNVKKLIQHAFSIPNNITKGEEENDTPILVGRPSKCFSRERMGLLRYLGQGMLYQRYTL